MRTVAVRSKAVGMPSSRMVRSSLVPFFSCRAGSTSQSLYQQMLCNSDKCLPSLIGLLLNNSSGQAVEAGMGLRQSHGEEHETQA